MLGRLPLACLLVAIGCCGCSTETLLKKQRLAALSAELSYLQSTRQLLSQTPNPETAGDVSVFLSATTLNQVMAAADDLTSPLPGIKGATFHLASVRSAFSEGLPSVEVTAWAEKPSVKLRLDMSITATLEPVINAGDPSTMELHVVVQKVVPVLHWGVFQIRRFWFAHNLIHLKVQEYAHKLPEMTVPLRADFDASVPSTVKQIVAATPDGHLYGNLTVPAFHVGGSFLIDNVIYLHDGVHLFGHVVSLAPRTSS